MSKEALIRIRAEMIERRNQNTAHAHNHLAEYKHDMPVLENKIWAVRNARLAGRNDELEYFILLLNMGIDA